MRLFPFIKIDDYWWRVKYPETLNRGYGFSIVVENCLGGYHLHKLEATDEIKFFERFVDAWAENDRIESELERQDDFQQDFSEVATHDYSSKAGKLEAYITREGKVVDVSSYNEGFSISAHQNYCSAHGIDEEQMLKERQWVKLTKVLPDSYIFYGRHLTEEQRCALEDIGYQIDEE